MPDLGFSNRQSIESGTSRRIRIQLLTVSGLFLRNLLKLQNTNFGFLPVVDMQAFSCGDPVPILYGVVAGRYS
jgi:hypothetical protein